MTLDPQLLGRARAASSRLADAEQVADRSRVEYHTAIRRLHLAGGSLREIAETLSLSHQRVQQIVSGAGGSWWRHVWRSRTPRADMFCTWCGRPSDDVEKLIAGPHVYICDACVAAAARAAADEAIPGSVFQPSARNGKLNCSFCGKRAGKDRSLFAGRPGNICSECLRVCQEILS
jgi:ClpX C4-type zinc finger protein